MELMFYSRLASHMGVWAGYFICAEEHTAEHEAEARSSLVTFVLVSPSAHVSKNPSAHLSGREIILRSLDKDSIFISTDCR